MSFTSRLGVCGALCLLAGATALAQRPADAPAALTAADYARAEKFMTYNTTPLVLRTGVRASWLPGDPARPLLVPRHDGEGRRGGAGRSGQGAEVGVRSAAVQGGRARGSGAGAARPAAGATPRRRPTARAAAFIRDWNLWVRDVASGRETQLTRDGVKDFGYATDNAGWARSDRPILRWSPDSKKIATFQQDQRGVGEMYLVDTTVGHPTLQAWKYPLPGDHVVTMIQRVVIDVDTGKIVRLQLPPDQHRSTLCDDVACRGDWGDVQWSPDSSTRRVRLDGARSPARAAARRRRGDRRDPRRAGGEGRDVLRIGQRRGQLALSAGVERSDLVLRARQLGPSLPARSEDRPREERDHQRQRQRHAAAARRREEPPAVFRRGRPRAGARSVLPPSLPRRPGRQGTCSC